jgi:hypothetical protein
MCNTYYILYLISYYILYACIIYYTHNTHTHTTHTHTHTHMHIYITGVLYALWNVAVCVQRGSGQYLVVSGAAIEVLYISVYISVY